MSGSNPTQQNILTINEPFFSILSGVSRDMVVEMDREVLVEDFKLDDVILNMTMFQGPGR